MKIVLITSSFYPDRGGVETHVEAVARQLTGSGHEVVILVRHSKRPARLTHGGAQVLRLPVGRLALRSWLLTHRRLLAAADVFHSHDYFLLQLQRLYPNKRFVHTFHGYEGYPIQKEAIIIRRVINETVNASVAVGAFIEQWYGTKCDLVTYGGIDPVKLPAQAPVWDMMYYGRFEPDTGIREYLKAFALVLETKPTYRILLVGSGSLGSAVRRLQAQYPNQVEVMGTMPHAEVLELLNQSRIACVSGYLAILEAAYSGKIIVSNYNTPIKRDYLDCHPLAKSLNIGGTPKELAAGMLKPKRATDTAEAWARRQTWAHLSNQYLQLYQSGGNHVRTTTQ